MVDADGTPRKHWASPDLWVTCALGPYNFEYMTEVTKEIVSLYKVDGIFSNRWAGHGVCYCELCKKLFKEATGFDLPRTRDIKTLPVKLILFGTRNVCLNCGRFGTMQSAP